MFRSIATPFVLVYPVKVPGANAPDPGAEQAPQIQPVTDHSFSPESYETTAAFDAIDETARAMADTSMRMC